MADGDPRSAAVLYTSAGYSTAGTELWGINVASAGMLQALIRYGRFDRFSGVVSSEPDAAAFLAEVATLNPELGADTVSVTDFDRIAAIGTLMLPGPGLSSFAWMRRSLGRRAYSLCGITHTTATPVVLDAIASWPIAPLYPWDAVICTSAAVRQMVRTVLEDQLTYLQDRFGPINASLPALPVIPLGIECARFAPNPEARISWRAELGIAEEDRVALFLGRLSFHGKAHPLPLFQAMQAAAQRVQPRLHLIMAGWFANQPIEEAYRTAAAEICPDVAVHFIDGREIRVRETIWHAADFFVAPIDNIQETFGLAPIEAMAAGLPCVVSDWDGLKETVRHEVDGYRIPTVAAPSGVGADLALRFMAELDDSAYFIGQSSQAVAIDSRLFCEALVQLISDDDRRLRMGNAARDHARLVFDWSVVVEQYLSLWGELRRLRVAAPLGGPEVPSYPARPDPFHAFQGYPTTPATPDKLVVRTEMAQTELSRYFESPMVSFAHQSLPDKSELGAMLDSLDGGALTIADLLDAQPAHRRRKIWRGIVWLAKFGFVTIR
jgi:glycosyltransferase involved in cell wall biosynthesis